MSFFTEEICVCKHQLEIAGDETDDMMQCYDAYTCWLFSVAKSRNVVIPSELETQLASLFAKVHIAQKHAKLWSAMGKSRIDCSQQHQDYRIIVDGLQVSCLLWLTYFYLQTYC
jgi:hypothetical protein